MMVWKKSFFTLLLVSLIFLTACSTENQGSKNRYQGGFFDYFDTYIQIIIYAEDQETFNAHFQAARQAFAHYHGLFDIFSQPQNQNTLYTVNEQAGVAPVLMEAPILELLTLSKEAYQYTDGMLNITLGPVLSLWRQYRQVGVLNPENAQLPNMSQLEQLAELAQIDMLEINLEDQTVFLKEAGMSLDVGATAKSFAAQQVANLLRAQGVESAIINAGGDVVIIGQALSQGESPWNIGIQNPLGEGLIDSVLVSDVAVSTSGGNLRAYMVNGISYHHIIDPLSLMPASHFSAVTVIHQDAMVAEILSTALFIASFEQGYLLAENFGAAVLWVLPDGGLLYNQAYVAISQNIS